MSGQSLGINPKKKNRYSDQGVLHPGIKAVRTIRAKLLAAEKSGAPQEELQRLRRKLKEAKKAGK